MNFQSKQIEDHSQASKMVAVEDELLVEKCLEIMRTEKRAATSVFQRRLQLGYSRAARLLEILEERGFVGPFTGSSSREILRYE